MRKIASSFFKIATLFSVIALSGKFEEMIFAPAHLGWQQKPGCCWWKEKILAAKRVRPCKTVANVLQGACICRQFVMFMPVLI
nr:hypothetical protein [uncultured Cohaesibacter sp.]